MDRDTIRIIGYSQGDTSVGIGSSRFEIDTGLHELNIRDKEFIIREIIRAMWELLDNGNLHYSFSDEVKMRLFTGNDSGRILREEAEKIIGNTKGE